MTRILSALALVAIFALQGFSVAADTPVACGKGGASVVNHPIQCATNSTENTVSVTVSPGYTATILFVDDAAWHLRGSPTVSTTDLPVAADQSLTLDFTETQTLSTVRTSADGTLKIVVLSVRPTAK